MGSRRGLALGVTVVGGAYAMWVLLDGVGDSVAPILGNGSRVLVGSAAFAAFGSGWAAYLHAGRERAGWACMALATAAWAVGTAVCSGRGLLEQQMPMPWSIVMAYLVYLAGELMLIFIAVLLLVRVSTLKRSQFALLTSGLLLIMASDVAIVYFAVTRDLAGRADGGVGWVLGFVAIGLAALFTSTPGNADLQATERTSSRLTIWLSCAVVATSVALFMSVLIAGLGQVFVGVVLVVLAVTLRQCLVTGDNRRLRAELADRESQDTLTGLANRSLFSARLRHAVARHQRNSSSVAVMLLDLDGFTRINETFGLSAGDATLMRVAARVRGAVRDCDTVARLGDDEFAILMEGHADDCHAVAQCVVQAFERPFPVGGQQLLVQPSAGLTRAEFTDVELSADELLRQARVAMAAAKCSATRRLCTYFAELGPTVSDTAVAAVATVSDEVPLLDELRHAIEQFELAVFYQPKVDMRSGEIVGLEALIRWPHPQRGMLAPYQFLSLVRQHGLMQSMTTVVLELALDDAAVWYGEGIGVPVAVNVFAPTVSDAMLPDQIMGALQSRGLGAAALTIEITEDLLLDNMDSTRSVLDSLRNNGIRVAIDDFGSGCSALWYLREFPVDEIKLDREFIAPVLTNPASAAIVRSVVDLAKSLQMSLVAEGVENADTAHRLLEIGCDVAQGYHYSRPLPAAEVMGLLARQKRGTTTAPAPAEAKPN